MKAWEDTRVYRETSGRTADPTGRTIKARLKQPTDSFTSSVVSSAHISTTGSGLDVREKRSDDKNLPAAACLFVAVPPHYSVSVQIKEHPESSGSACFLLHTLFSLCVFVCVCVRSKRRLTVCCSHKTHFKRQGIGRLFIKLGRVNVEWDHGFCAPLLLLELEDDADAEKIKYWIRLCFF